MTSFEIGASIDDAFGQTATENTEELRTASTVARPRRQVPASLLKCAIAVAAAVVTATMMSTQSGPIVWIAVAFAATCLGLELSALPACERDSSVRPATRLVAVGGTGLLAASAFGMVAPSEIRGALSVLGAAALTVVISTLCQAATRPAASIVLVGGRIGVGGLIRQWADHDSIDIKGVFLVEAADDSAAEMMGVPILGSVDDVPDIAIDLGVDQVVVAAGPLVSSYDVRRMAWALEGSSIDLTVDTPVHGATPRRIRPRLLGHRLLLSIRPGRRHWVAQLVKDVFDRVVAVVLLVVLMPLFLVVTVAVRRDSPGPALFRQVRIGRQGRPFTMLKFRTMMLDAEARLADLRICNQGAGPMFKMTDDPRTTRVGGILRRTSLDELPQLFNVIAGHMSLVGPRPCLPREAEEYDDWERRRLSAKPGMTGAWQVGGRSLLTWQDSVRLDVDYADNSSMTTDLLILAKTIRTVVRRDGAM